MFNQENYLNLLCSIAPKKIESEEQYEKYLPIVESFLFATTRTEEQEMVGHILALLVEECKQPRS
jgi:hypothetical protein